MLPVVSQRPAESRGLHLKVKQWYGRVKEVAIIADLWELDLEHLMILNRAVAFL